MKTTIKFLPIKKLVFLLLFAILSINCAKDNDDLNTNDSFNLEAEDSTDTDADPDSDTDTDSNTDTETDSETDTDTDNEDEIPNYTTTEALEVLELINNARAEADLDLDPLVLNNALNKVAVLHSQYMDNINEETEFGSDGSWFFQRTAAAGYEGNPRDQNILFGAKNAQEAYEIWINDVNDKASILSETVSEMGLGKSGKYWTQIFGLSN